MGKENKIKKVKLKNGKDYYILEEISYNNKKLVLLFLFVLLLFRC